MENKKMRILIADDNKDFCDCLSNYISKQDDMEIVSIAHDGNEAVTKIITDNPDVALIDGIMYAYSHYWRGYYTESFLFGSEVLYS